MEWKEFILIFFGGMALFTIIITAQSTFALNKLESVFVSFEISPETLDFLNKTKHNNVYEHEVACLNGACSEELLQTEQVVACYKGCKFYNDYLIAECMTFCEDFYEGTE